jgi:hypothetical protein
MTDKPMSLGVSEILEKLELEVKNLQAAIEAPYAEFRQKGLDYLLGVRFGLKKAIGIIEGKDNDR